MWLTNLTIGNSTARKIMAAQISGVGLVLAVYNSRALLSSSGVATIDAMAVSFVIAIMFPVSTGITIGTACGIVIF
jgi:uncharacterized membrane protein